MIHFTFTDRDTRYLFIKFDSKDDEKWLTPTTINKQVWPNLTDYLNLIDPICYLPTWGNRPPITQDFFFKYKQPSGDTIYYCAIGLWQEIYKFLKRYNIEFDGLTENQQFFKRTIKHSLEEFKEIVRSWNLKYEPRPYQYEAAYKILQWKSSVSQLATRAGKTLISYILFRYAMEYMNVHNILMIVPSIDLVKQAYNDFSEYQEFFKTETVWGGGKLCQSSNLTVGTFQSLIKFLDKTSKKYDPSFYDKFDLVFVDETHRATANQIKTIISQPFMKDLKLSFGMTGTLPKDNTIESYCLHALLGAKIQEINPKELMDEGYISPIQIYQYRLTYTNSNINKYWINCAEYCLGKYVEEIKDGKKKKVKLDKPKFLFQYKKILPVGIADAKKDIYGNKDKSIINDQLKQYDLFGNLIVEEPKRSESENDEKYIKLLNNLIKNSTSTNGLVIEKMLVHLLDERIDFLCNEIIPKCPNNTLILAHHVEYINYLVEQLKQRFPDRNIEVVTGSVSNKKRDKVKQTLKDNNNCILVASYACMSTGITLSNLCYGILFESFKSNVVNMQSLGRGLGLSDMKEKYIVYDIIDVLPGNKILGQGKAKINIYKDNNYPYKIVNKKI